jgi:rod shape-determining protein MreC
MQQLLSFLIRNSNRILFLLLLLLAMVFTVQSHDYHRSKAITSANFVTGGVYQQLSDVREYFHLASQNDALAKENARLKSLLFNQKDSTHPVDIDTIHGVRKTDVLVAKVIHNSYNVHENFLTLNAGSKQGIRSEMGVINDRGIVGIVENTSPNYATVISILNVESRINAKIKKSNHFGSLIWDGKNTGYVQLIDVPRLASVRKGDTIVTGGQSLIFPENIGIGTIDKVYVDKETNYFTLSIRLFNDMTNLGYVYILKNKDRKEVTDLENLSKEKHE